jgi:hypothetical protein
LTGTTPLGAFFWARAGDVERQARRARESPRVRDRHGKLE